VKVHSLTLFALFALPGACDVTLGSTSRPATSQPPCLSRKPNARVATDKEDRDEDEDEGQGDDDEREEDEQLPPPPKNTRKKHSRKKSKRGRKSR
jgi:hypothetical protein